jgi:hypothetical protein
VKSQLSNPIVHSWSCRRGSLLQAKVAALQTCLDNLECQLGKEHVGKLDIFVDPFVEYAFAVGDPDQAKMMHLEITAAFHGSDPPPSD